jgi:hypothetical protein
MMLVCSPLNIVAVLTASTTGAIAVAEALSENNTLRELDLDGNEVSAAGLLAFS